MPDKGLLIFNLLYKNMEYIKLNNYFNYSENQGVVICVNCEKQLWISYPTEGEEVECDCGCIMKFIENSEEK